MVVGEASWVHQAPALPGGPDGAVVAQEAAASALGEHKGHVSLGKAPQGWGPCLLKM